MRLFRHGALGAERAGAVANDGSLRDLSILVPDITPDWLGDEKLDALAAIDLGRLPQIPTGTRIGVPVAGMRQFVCIGLNYRKHAEEAGQPIPEEPVVFTKALTCLTGPNDPVVLPRDSQTTDWEIELGFVIGKTAQRVAVQQALEHVAGYVLANDVSERDWQLKKAGQWTKGKSFDTFGPVGPWLVTRDEVADPQVIPLELRVNGEVRQRSSTADQIFGVAAVLSYLSRFMTLLPGDLVITGTPEGVGLGMQPPQFLRRGDLMELDAGVLGRQHHEVR